MRKEGRAEQRGREGVMCVCEWILSTEDTPCTLCVYGCTRWRSGNESAMLTLTVYWGPGAPLSTWVNPLILPSGLVL